MNVDASSTLVDLLRRAAGSPGAGLRILDRQGSETWLSWPAVYDRARRLAGGLRRVGVGGGERVALVFPTCASFFDAFFGTLLAGATPVPLYPPERLGRLDEYHGRTANMLGAAGARLVLADPRVRRLLGETVALARPPLGCLSPDDLERVPWEADAVRPSDLALVQFSSGTTREPRAVALSHRAVVAQAVTLNRFWPDTAEVSHSGVSWLPLYHDMGLIGCVLPALERPGTLTLLPPETFVASPAAWLRAISTYRGTISPAPNFAYGHCLRRIADADLAGVDLSCWRVALDGAESVVPRVARDFVRRFSAWGLRAEALTPVYGLSEASLAVTFSALDRPFASRRFDRARLDPGAGPVRESPDGREIVSVGRPIPGVSLRIVDERGQAAPLGHVGLVECAGPSVMEGYLGEPAATAAALRDGWLRTGDLGFVFEGDLYLAGRAKDMLLLHGRNHAPEEVEQAAAGVDGVRPGAVVAASWLPEDADGERLVVFVEAARGLPAREFDRIARDCEAKVLAATALSPDRVVVLPAGSLPRTSSGKLRRQAALAEYLAGTLGPPAPVTRLRLTVALLRSALAFLRARIARSGRLESR
jgi:acyl-CoA synthetase (AMP-forming)/AMP-acid ligase II